MSYDLAGNMLSNGQGQSYQWDAEKRLTKIIYSSNASTEFFYDGRSRRVKVIEKNSSEVVLSDRRTVWAGGNQPAEERDASNVVKIRYFANGEQIPAASAPANKLFYTKDHLSSVRELTDSTGALRVSYNYDLFGKRTKLSGDLDTVVGYTGHHHHAASGLILTMYRAYYAELGRWLSRVPIEDVSGEVPELEEGPNLYAYVLNDPMNFTDTYGLSHGPKKQSTGKLKGAKKESHEKGMSRPKGGALGGKQKPNFVRVPKRLNILVLSVESALDEVLNLNNNGCPQGTTLMPIGIDDCGNIIYDCRGFPMA